MTLTDVENYRVAVRNAQFMGSVSQIAMAALDEVEALQKRVEDTNKERDQLAAQLNETHTDENGTVWTRPTAWAYMQVCKAREAGIRLAAGARKDANKSAAVNARLREALERDIAKEENHLRDIGGPTGMRNSPASALALARNTVRKEILNMLLREGRSECQTE